MTHVIRKQVKSLMPEVVAMTALCAEFHEYRGDILAEISKCSGWAELGRGHFSAVYAIPGLDDVVIKVGFTKAYEDDDMRDRFPWYVQHIQRHHSKFFPKVYALEWASEKLGGIYVCAMERLEKITRDDKIRDLATGFEHSSRCYRYSKEPNPDVEPWVNRFVNNLRYLGRLDIHDENVMKRPNGDLVVTDPLTSFNSYNSWTDEFKRAA